MISPPILYSFRRCPYAMRARMALLISGAEVEVREIVLRNKPPEMLAASPKGTVPVLVTENGVVDQSLDIMRWALERNDPEYWLEGADHTLIERNDGPFKHHLDRYKYPDRHHSDPIIHRAAGLEILADLDARLAKHRNLAGEGRSFTDIAIMPFVRQFAATDRTWFDMQSLPRLQHWLETHHVSRLFARAMVRLKPWQPGDARVMLGVAADQDPERFGQGSQ